MASDQSMTQAITQGTIKAVKAVMMTVREAEGPTRSRRPMHTVPRINRPESKQPTLDW